MTIRNKFIHQTDCGNYQELSAFAAAYTKHIIRKEPEARLGLPTGGTPVLMYNFLRSQTRIFPAATLLTWTNISGCPPLTPEATALLCRISFSAWD